MRAAPIFDVANVLSGAWKPLLDFKLVPEKLAQLQSDYLAESTALWNRLLAPADGADGAGKPKPLDRRFAAPDWMGSPSTAYLAQMYLLNARTLMQMADAIEADEKTKARIRFAVQQWVDAASPANYLALNPEAQRKALETQGESIAKGVMHLLNDLRQGHLSQTDESVFEVGRNVATTEGAVVFESELFQLLEYKPLTAKVHARPMLFVPPCINKYYILDLQPENSLIRYTVEQGHRVFVMSWRNPEPSMAKLTWDDYIEQGPLKAIDVVRDITGSDKLNTLGFCIGGTILATALAVLAARGERPASSMTLLTTFLDFSSTGVLDIFIDEAMVKMREMTIGADSPGGGSLLKGQELATTFSFLRPNDLVWNYVVANYLKGETPPPFDLLYWNSDGTNLPGPMYCWYLRNTYLENNLVKPGKLTVCGEKVDLGSIKVPAFIYASREDHIVPWEGAYRNLQVLGGDTRFVLGASGHIAGVINPPTKGKRSHWVADPGDPVDSHVWLDHARELPGSWWGEWSRWLKPLSGKQIPAPAGYGSAKYPVIEPAPGRYVKQKAT
ncbi:class I poly(R)-hydroxyalkanoic acid synthase [Piscinibacter koreensis]|uniref:Class I poly(R)-hydroxyalkanoic acid synthase n=1 Tax=Piscinibacter koreensis TaxID=2742824 RepID=A0A7Y6NL20_9BURK|nr:class I poly(R)-hydroxyalkanoic acid synthase [Schlegelella koreensis]NUZ05051.1 class I poly(R)-hydroxyalkanoic acid synthase [Schlegelella koreensis]